MPSPFCFQQRYRENRQARITNLEQHFYLHVIPEAEGYPGPIGR